MAEPLDFETTLAARLQARAAMASRPFDATAIANAAVAARPARRLTLRWPSGAMRWAVLAGAAILAAVAGTLLAGTLLREAPVAPSRLAISTPMGVYIADADGTNRDVLITASANASVDWSPDGALLLVTEQNDREARVTVFDPDGNVRWTKSGVGYRQAAWSHRGHRVAWFSGQDIMVTDVDADRTVALRGPRYSSWGPLAWSPDDRWVAGVQSQTDARRNVLVIAPSDGLAPADPLPDAPTTSVGDVSWAPDGRSIAVVDDPCPLATNIADACPSNLQLLEATTGRRLDGLRGDTGGGLLMASQRCGRPTVPGSRGRAATPPTSR